MAPLRPSLPFPQRGSALSHLLIGFLSRSFLKYASNLRVEGLENFLKILDRRRAGLDKRGLVTASNHVSVLDDPVLWGGIPLKYATPTSQMRHALGSYDICFQNPVISKFFASGQVMPTYRLLHSDPGGPFQDTMTHAIQLLSENSKSNLEAGEGGKWVHIHPEGRTYQSDDYRMRYFKWGIARMLLESTPEIPRFVPMFITGFDKVMPEDRGFPTFLPRVGKDITITFGEEVDSESRFGDLKDRWTRLVKENSSKMDLVLEKELGVLPQGPLRDSKEVLQIRIECARRVWDEVQKLRIERGFEPQEDKDALASTWKGVEGAKKMEGMKVDET